MDKPLHKPIPAPKINLVARTSLKFVIKTGKQPAISIKPSPSKTVFFLPINLTTKSLSKTQIVITNAGKVIKFSADAWERLGS